jgi:hypothetical protein
MLVLPLQQIEDYGLQVGVFDIGFAPDAAALIDSFPRWNKLRGPNGCRSRVT